MVANSAESETRFRGAFETSAIGMALVSLEGGWLEVNKSLLNMLGYTEEELLAKTFQDITHPDDLETDLEYVKKMIDGEISTYKMEKRYFHKDGHVIWILLSVSMVKDDDDKPLYFVSQIQDITDVKEKTRLLEEANEVKKKFIKIISHQLRTPLTTIGWGLESVLSGKYVMNDELREILEPMYESHRHLIRRLNDLLFAADIADGKITMKFEEVDPVKVFEKVKKSFEEKIASKSLIINVNVVGESGLIKADADKLANIMRQLFSNAIVYTKTGSIDVTLKGGSNEFLFEIKDTGIGIPSDEQKNIFEQFYRAKNSFEVETDHSGIGLFLAKSFVSAHDGEIGFESEEGRGSTFWVSL